MTGVIVNEDGQRFVAEDSYHARTSQFVMEQPRLRGVPHRRQRARRARQLLHAGADDRRLRHDRRAETALGLPAGRWRRRWALQQDGGGRRDLDLHKGAEWLAPR